MKKHLLTLALAALALGATAQQRTLTVLHTNDTHSCVMPLRTTITDTTLAGRGGFVRRAALVKQERRKDPNLLLFDSGDFSQGSPYYTVYRGDVEIDLMNLMHYDAATIGNHEFDFGLDNLARLFRRANFPIVCANYDFTGTPVEGLVKPYVILRRNGIKVGVFGIAPQLEGLVSKENCQGVRYLDPIATAQSMADLLKNKKRCDIVICLSHLGWSNDEESDQHLMARTRNIDLVLGGHTHTYFTTLKHVNNLDGHAVPNDQNGKHGAWVGKINIEMKKR